MRHHGIEERNPKQGKNERKKEEQELGGLK